MKYKFERIDDDTTKLSYKDKEFEIKRNIDLAKRTQGLYATARMKMMADLTKQGMTRKDFTIERKENGKTYYDNTNAKEVEQSYIETAQIQMFSDLAEKYTGMDLQTLIDDIGLTEEETEEFGKGFSKALKGDVKTPSKEK